MNSKFISNNNLTKKTDIWNGETNSIFHSPNVTIMTFKAQKGFTFNDEGHVAEQITILLKGKFEFSVGNKTKIMNPQDFVYIKPWEKHGGKALTDIEGFDVFYPLRKEKKYES